MSSSRLPLAKISPLGLYFKQTTCEVGPTIRFNKDPERGSHSCTPSPPAVASVKSTGLKSTTLAAIVFMVRNSRPVRASHNFTELESRMLPASISPSRLNAIDVTFFGGPVCTTSSGCCAEQTLVNKIKVNNKCV